MTMDEFAPFLSTTSKFVVRNITSDRNKTIKIFNFPILYNQTRDLLQIPGIAESDIRASLLKGELRNKLLVNDIFIEESDIDLLQFNEEQKLFLQSHGVSKGTQVTSSIMDVTHKEDIQLDGEVNDVNTVFYIPEGKFVQTAVYRIIVYRNGIKQLYLDDYFIAESEGPGTGYDTVIFVVAPTTTPLPIDYISADYYVSNS
jgi:hypothetical protein